jgi:hypothetical protein
MYTFYTLDTGRYNNRGKWIHTLTDNSKVLNPVFSHGILNNVDIQYSVPYVFNRNHGKEKHDFGDPAVTLGYQFLRQKDSKWLPNLRVTLQEIIPIGEYKQLEPSLNGTDATGIGSYQTAFGLNFQHLAKWSEEHYLRTRFVVNYIAARVVDVHGLSVYGGTPFTEGRIKPGAMWTADLAGEFTLTQNWALVMEGFTSHRQATHFKGTVGEVSDGRPGSIGRGAQVLYTLAPAIEYNFTSTIGLLAGTWFTVRGHNATHFNTYVVALNMFW